MEPTDDWGPAEEQHRRCYKYSQQTSTAKLMLKVEPNDKKAKAYNTENEKVQLYEVKP